MLLHQAELWKPPCLRLFIPYPHSSRVCCHVMQSYAILLVSQCCFVEVLGNVYSTNWRRAWACRSTSWCVRDVVLCLCLFGGPLSSTQTLSSERKALRNPVSHTSSVGRQKLFLHDSHVLSWCLHCLGLRRFFSQECRALTRPSNRTGSEVRFSCEHSCTLLRWNGL